MVLWLRNKYVCTVNKSTPRQKPNSITMDHMRLNRYNALYTGPVGGRRNSEGLKVKSARDKSALAMMRAPPELYAVTNIQSRTPMSMHLDVQRHREPTLMFDAAERFRQTQERNRAYYQGGSLFNQHIQRQIAELSKMSR